VAEGYLKRSWNDRDGESHKGQKFNRDIESLLQVRIQVERGGKTRNIMIDVVLF
jgi:hypothetical protein